MQEDTQHNTRCGRHHHYHPDHHRGPRLLRFLTVVIAFAATTAGLHALSDHYGWSHHHRGMHHVGARDALSGAPASVTGTQTLQPVLPRQAT